MDVFKLNKRTRTDIIAFGELDLAKVASILIQRNNIHDAKIVLQHVNTKISCRNKKMIHWLYMRDLLELSPSDISYICKKAYKKEFIIAMEKIDVYPYLQDCANNPHFLKWVFQYKRITKLITPIYTSNLSLLTFLSKYQTYDEQYIHRVCKEGNLSSFTYLINHTSLDPSLFHRTVLIHNHSHFFDYLQIQDISKHTYIDCLRSNAYDSIRLSHKLNPNLFTIVERTNLFKTIICYIKHVPYDFFIWYKSMTLPVNVSDALCKSANTLLLKTLYKIQPKKHFLMACKHNNVPLVKYLIDKLDIHIVVDGLLSSSIEGHVNVTKYLCDYIKDDEYIYLVLYKMISINLQHDDIIKILYNKNRFIYPSLLPIYSIMNKNSYSWAKDSLYLFLKPSDNYYNTFQYYINLICYYGNTNLFLMLEPFIDEGCIYEYFINACSSRKGLFIANYILYKYDISPRTIELAFYNTNDLEVIRWLYTPDIDIRKNNDHYFRFSCLNNHIDVAQWLITVCPNYSFEIENNVIVDYAIFLSWNIDKSITLNDDCNICLCERSNCKTECNHEYCYHCINTWYAKNRTCPICRTSIDCVYSENGFTKQ
tara:strand:+ start:2829 stop:4613 length:1785 start_codon:yes stop_codon:yes gene_type:complete